MIDAVKSVRELDKHRIDQFERELQLKIDSLNNLNAELLSMETLRKGLLDKLSQSDNLDVVIYKRRLNILKDQLELSMLNLSLDQLRLESQYENQALQYLVSATKPYTQNETPASRQERLLIESRRSSDETRQFLIQCLDYRSRAVQYNYDLGNELSKIRSEFQLNRIQESNSLQEKLHEFLDEIQQNNIHSNETKRRVTGEYLIMRHNARVAKEILTRSQNNAAFERSKLQNNYNEMIENVVNHKNRMETTSETELEILTNGLRLEVISKERELDELLNKSAVKKMKRKEKIRNLRAEIQYFTNKYDELQEKRRVDIISVSNELKGLKEMIADVELKLSVSIKSSLPDKVLHDIMKNLKSRLKSLQQIQYS
eukprot:gene11615-15553_t